MKTPTCLLFVLLCLLLAACHTNTPGVSFYYWRTDFKLDSLERNALKQNNVSRLFVRYFDVGMEGGTARPLGIMHADSFPNDMTIVPVVYIKNEVFGKRQDSLPTQVYRLVSSISSRAGTTTSEVQFDCDWTERTQAAYFRFLKSFKAISGKAISATIRLHQVKYRVRTRVPPVDRGVLMYYNMGRIGSEANSIYERKTTVRYTAYVKSYPLPLDIALPVFSWGILIRNGKVETLLNKTSEAELQHDTNFTRIREGRYAVEHSIFKGGYYLRAGDEVKIEAISEAALRDMAKDLSQSFDTLPQEIIYYDLDAQNLIRYHETTFEKLAARFH